MAKTAALIILLLLVVSWIAFFMFYAKPTITGEVVLEDVTISEIESSFPKSAFVSKIIDGDTVIIAGESVRLLGMDTDERGYPCFTQAKKRIEELILDKEVK